MFFYEMCIITIIIIIGDFAVYGHASEREKRASGDAEAYQDSGSWKRKRQFLPEAITTNLVEAEAEAGVIEKM